jgi:hypothetical protein
MRTGLRAALIWQEIWSIGIRRHRLVRSTAKIKIPPTQRPQQISIIQPLICVIVIRSTFIWVGA